MPKTCRAPGEGAPRSFGSKVAAAGACAMSWSAARPRTPSSGRRRPRGRLRISHRWPIPHRARALHGPGSVVLLHWRYAWCPLPVEIVAQVVVARFAAVGTKPWRQPGSRRHCQRRRRRTRRQTRARPRRCAGRAVRAPRWARRLRRSRVPPDRPAAKASRAPRRPSSTTRRPGCLQVALPAAAAQQRRHPGRGQPATLLRAGRGGQHPQVRSR